MKVVLDNYHAGELVQSLLARSQWFEFTPLPDDLYEIRYKAENEHWIMEKYAEHIEED